MTLSCRIARCEGTPIRPAADTLGFLYDIYELTPTGVGWLRQMITIRAFEDKVQEMFGQRLVPGTTHVCQDQEASCVGAVSALEPTDILSITYRGHGQANKEGEP